MFKTCCDYCKLEINGAKIAVDFEDIQKADGEKLFYVTKHFHPDCFNFVFSTDYRRVIDDKNV